MVLANDQDDDIYRSMSPDFDRIVKELLQHQTPCLPDDRAEDLDRDLLHVNRELIDHGSPSDLLPQIRRLIRSGATTSGFEDYELGDGNVADVVSDRFLYQAGYDRKPNQDLFKCISLLIMAGPKEVTNRRYVGNGGSTSIELIEYFLSTGKDYISSKTFPSGGDKKNIQILFGQSKRLLQLIYAQRMIYEIPIRDYDWEPCRLCQRMKDCRRADHPLDDYLIDLIMSFIEDDLVHLNITGVAPVSPDCYDHHHELSRNLPFLQGKLLLRKFQHKDLRDLILNLIVSDRRLVSTFIDGMHQSVASRRLLRRLLRMQHVPDLLLQTPLFMSEFIRRKDVKSVLILASAVPPEYDTSIPET